MLCCCRKGKNTSYAVGDDGNNKKDSTALNNSIVAADNARIQTGKGALSSSNQSIGPEAQLDKGTIAATQQQQQRQQQSAPVTEQPIASSTASTQNHQQQPIPPTSGVPADTSQIQPQVESITSSNLTLTEKEVKEDKKVDIGLVTSSSSSSSPPPSQSGQYSTTIKVESSTSSSNKANQKDKIEIETFNNNINTELDAVELAITKAEQGNASPRELKSSLVPQIASQLQALTLQVTEQAAGQGQGQNRMADQGLQSAVSRLEAVASRLESLAAQGGGGAGGASDEVAPFVLEYDAILTGPLAAFLKLSSDIGGEIKTQGDMVKATFDALRDFLVVASKSREPSQDVTMELLKPVGSKMQEVLNFRDTKRRSDFFNHLSTISESIPACGWISIAPKPAPYVKEMLDAGTFYSNRVLKEYKAKDERHVEWTKAWSNVLKDLHQYVKSNHTTGVSWNPQGGDAMSCAASAPAPPPPSAGAPPPPPPPGPPPPPPPPGLAPAADEGPSDGAKNALFASINQGDGVTKGLRKVTDNMKTHKNPALRQGPAPFKPASPKPVPAAKPVVPVAKVAAPVKAPVMEKQGKKWVVEHHKDNKNIVINGDIKETVYVYKCEGSVVQVKGKINSVVIDSCKKSAVVLEDVLSSVEFINCQSVQGQVTGKICTLSIDKTDGCQFYLSNSCLDADIVSAKSSEMNVLVPMADGDFKEFALPEQYKTKYDGTTMVTTVSESI